MEEELGLAPGAQRSNPAAFSGVHGLDWNAEAAGQERERAAAQAKATFIPEGRQEPAGAEEEAQRRRRRSRSRSRSRDRRRRSRSRSRDGGRRRRSRSPSRERRQRRNGSSSPRHLRSRSPRRENEHEKEKEGGCTIEVWKGGDRLGRLALELGKPSQECIFGRLPSCGVPLEHLSVSRHHARLTGDAAGRLWLTDLGSAHGTQVDGVWIRAKEPKELTLGSAFRFGASTREFRVAALPAAAQHG